MSASEVADEHINNVRAKLEARGETRSECWFEQMHYWVTATHAWLESDQSGKRPEMPSSPLTDTEWEAFKRDFSALWILRQLDWRKEPRLR